MLILHEQQSKASMETKTYVHKNAVEKTWAIRNTTWKMLSKGKESKVLNSYVCCSLFEAALFNRILVEIGMVLDNKMKIEQMTYWSEKFTPFISWTRKLLWKKLTRHVPYLSSPPWRPLKNSSALWPWVSRKHVLRPWTSTQSGCFPQAWTVGLETTVKIR